MIPMVDLQRQYQICAARSMRPSPRSSRAHASSSAPMSRRWSPNSRNTWGGPMQSPVPRAPTRCTWPCRRDLGPGDEVITTPFTFIATAEAIRYVGAEPVFVDIDPRTFNIDPDAVAEAITAHAGHSPGASVRPAAEHASPDPSGRRPPAASDRGLRTVLRRAHRRRTDGQRHRLRLLQLLPQQEPRLLRRRRPGHHELHPRRRRP
jgi:hypothetical protein